MRLYAAVTFFFFFFFLLFTFWENSLCPPPPTFRRRATPLKYQFYLYDRVHTTLVKNLSTTSMNLQICGSYLNNKYVQYTNCLKSHQDKRITNTHELTPYYDMKIPYFSYDKLYFIIHRSIILISNYSHIYAIQINSFARSDSFIQG